MTRIGLLSDTHSYLDPQIFTHFDACDEIWHAGDVGALMVAEQLRDFKPLRIVSGNIDRESNDLPANQHFKLEGLTVWMTHIGGSPPKYNPVVRPQLQLNSPTYLFVGIHTFSKLPATKRLRTCFLSILEQLEKQAFMLCERPSDFRSMLAGSWICK